MIFIFSILVTKFKENEGCEDYEEMDLMKAADNLQYSDYDKGNLNLVKCLLARFPESYIKPEWKILPIHFFAGRGQLEVVKFLMPLIKGPIIYFIDGRSQSRYKQSSFI